MEGDKGQQQRKVFHIGSRKSQLALIQTKQIKKQLKGLYPDLKFKIVPISTKGDQILDVALSKIGDKGLFTKELEDGILNKSLDFAVHSLKDMPTALPEGLTIGVIGKREIPNDALIVNEKNKGHTLETLPPGSVVGTSSLRRKSQIQKHFPHLAFKDVRGNLNTRLRKLDEGEYDCLILAASGMKRLGAGDRIQVLSEKHCFWAVGQGALSVECRADDAELLNLLSKIDDADTRAVCVAERALLRELEGGCQVPVGVSSSIEEGEGGVRQVHLYGIVLNIDGSKSVEGNIVGPLDQADSLGRTLARQLKDKGASEILEEIAAISRK